MVALKISQSFTYVCLTCNRPLPKWWIHSDERCWRPTSKICVELERDGRDLRGVGQPPWWGGPAHEGLKVPVEGVFEGTQYHQQEVRSVLVILNEGSEYQRSSLGGRRQEMVPVVWRYSHTGTWSVVLDYLGEGDMRKDQTSWSRST